MPVYVDNARIPFKNMIMSHMVADTIEELHDMAQKIGLKKEWFQDKPRHPHYDVSATKRVKAISMGAIEVETEEIVQIKTILSKTV